MSAGPFFLTLGRLPTAPSANRFRSQATGVSNDGQVVVGQAVSAFGLEAFRWTPSTGMVGLGDDPSGNFGSRALAVSGDGSVVAGNVTPNVSSFQAGAIWTGSASYQNLGYLSTTVGFFYLTPTAVSNDGQVIAGTGRVDTGNIAFRYTQAGGFTTLGHLETIDSANGASDMSGDGRVIVGSSGSSSATTRAFRWTADDGMQAIPGPNGRRAISAEAVSNDGRVIAGFAAGSPLSSIFLWTEGLGSEDLGRFPDTNEFVRVGDLNGNGTILVGEVGNSTTGFGGRDAVWWDRAGGFQLLSDVLTQNYGIDVGFWRLTTATGISPDGKWITGAAEDPFGNREAFLVHIPEAPSGLLVGSAGVMLFVAQVLRRRRSTT
jgi:probable HAF family extracellular repeat protein